MSTKYFLMAVLFRRVDDALAARKEILLRLEVRTYKHILIDDSTCLLFYLLLLLLSLLLLLLLLYNNYQYHCF